MSVDEDIKELVQSIARKCDLKPPVNVDYYPASEKGDGFASKTIAATIKNASESLDLFIKYAYSIPHMPEKEQRDLDRFYGNEVYFYDVIYPAYVKFLEERNVEDRFDNVSKCYGTSPKHAVALENLKKKNFELFDKTQRMNDEHLTYVLKIFAKFHAISFSFKDQEREKYDELVRGTFDYFSAAGRTSPLAKMVENGVNQFLGKLDPVEDKGFLDNCGDLTNRMLDILMSVDQTLDENSIITQGDCWVNNMMFLYEKNNYVVPKDMKLIDWQLVRPASPVYDLSYFFYTIATKEAISNLKHYLKLYHEELSKQIRILGSDPDKLYPFSVLEAEWKKFGKHGLAVCFIVLKAMLYSRDEIPNYEELSVEDVTNNAEAMFPALKNDEEFANRLRVIADHLLENGFL